MATFSRIYRGAYNISGIDWVDSDLPVATIDANGGTYTTNTYFYTTCYDTLNRRFIFSGGASPRRILPNEIVSYIAPSSVYGWNLADSGFSLVLRIESLDGTRWCEIYTNEDEWPYMSYYNDSVGQNASGTHPDALNYTGRYPLGTLTANVDGTVYYKAMYDTQYDSSCSSSSRTMLSGTTPLPVFNIAEELKVVYVINSMTTIYINQWGFNVTLTEDSAVIAWMGSDLWDDDVACVIGATQDNSTTGLGVLYHNHRGATQDDQDKWLAHFDHNSVTHYWQSTTYHRMLSALGATWQAKSAFPLTSSYLDWIVQANYNSKLAIMSTDGLRWISFTRAYASPSYLTVDSSEGVLWVGTETAGYSATAGLASIKVENGYIDFKWELVGYERLIHPPPIPFTDVFIAGEKIHPVITNHIDYQYSYIWEYTLVVSPDLPPPGESQLRFDIPEITSVMSDLITEQYVCYVKTKIKSNEDISDPDSLMGMSPESPSDLNIPLKAGDSCIVFEKYNRVYYYTAQAGIHITDLPDFARITDSLYWELVDVTLEAASIVPEQYDIVGLVDTNPVTVTHTKHNRIESYMPPTQLIHGGVIRTEGILGYIVSDTQIRFETIEITPLVNLKVNVYVSPL